ncbi:hypothetical protein JCM8208_000404 [Rhodotorula glutinis]
MELSWDGSIISMSELNPPPSSASSHSRGPPPHHPPPPARTSSPLGLRSAFEAAGHAQSTLLPSPPERAYLSSSPRPTPTYGATSLDPPQLEPRAPAPPAHAQERPPILHSHSHPLASFLHDSLSPPASPTASIASSSFPGGGGSRTRLSSCAGTAFSSQEASPRSRSARRRSRARARSTSRSGSAASSTASTDGSAHEDRAGELSSEDDHQGHASGLVMPSLHLDAAASAPPRCPSSSPARALGRARKRDAPAPPRARLLVLGKSADDRRTLARLVGRNGAAADDDEDDEDLRRTTSAASVAGATDMSFSYLSFRPSSSSHERSAWRAKSVAAAAAAADCPSGAFFEPLVHADALITLHHPVRDDVDATQLVDELTRPLERLEAKLCRAYPATTGLAQVVEAAGCGEYEACLFLFSSPPLASEIALARPISHVLPLLPVLVLPPSPTGKPQKTTALSHAVQEQLNTAGVRWCTALGPRSATTAASPLYMLPHDLFVQHAHDDDDDDDGDERRRAPHLVPSVTSLPASSPESEDAPSSSLSSSQEFVTPAHHPASASNYYDGTSAGSSIAGDHRERASAARGAARSLSASSRAGSSSSRSLSPRGHGHGQGPTRSATHHRRRTLSQSSFASSSAGGAPSSSAASSSTSLADLHRLQSLVHDPQAPAVLRSRCARAFLEWREVEVAARASGAGLGAWVGAAMEVPEAWGERALDEVEEGGGTGRRMLDFSRRVAERRKVLLRRAACSSGASVLRGAQEERDDDGDVLAASDDEDEHKVGRATGAASFATEPMTPRCTHRPLLSPITTRTAVTATATDSYFPFPAESASSASPVDPLALSTHSLTPSTSASTSSAAPSSALAASSVLVLPSADPFHLPSLLHLVGLNLRLAVFAPSFASTAASSSGSAASDSASASSSTGSRRVSEKREAARSSEKDVVDAAPPRPWAWWRTAAVVGLVFAAGVAVGTVVASVSTSGEAQAVGPAAWASRGRL